jgi:hypothetical protein
MNEFEKTEISETPAPKQPKPKYKTGMLEIRGCMQGQMIMADDFDDPIEGFEDYM